MYKLQRPAPLAGLGCSSKERVQAGFSRGDKPIVPVQVVDSWWDRPSLFVVCRIASRLTDDKTVRIDRVEHGRLQQHVSHALENVAQSRIIHAYT